MSSDHVYDPTENEIDPSFMVHTYLYGRFDVKKPPSSF